MGYRNETEQLRAKVERLEAQVGAIRGNLAGDRTARFGARVRRQQWIIAIFSVLASGVALLCVATDQGEAMRDALDADDAA